ncbi:MAG: DNA polymerase III subunit delta', partial [Pseudomonadota bacterium]|nr:DNA polymerase III subunit delta' [Pseudomonadota bacterium]
PWHRDAWAALQGLRERLPHAILFHGNQGIGKTAFATAFAAALLCEAQRPDGHACGTCLSCGWFRQYSHPDYRRVRPEVLDEADGDAPESDGAAGAGDTGADEKAETKNDGKKSSRAPSKDIRIDQIRALANFMNLSTHRRGKRVVLLYPAEALNGPSANALLKTLEEPPPDTVFLMVTDSIDRLLPTILSRCRQFALPMPPAAEALAWLAGQQVEQAGDWLAEQGGAPLTALAQARLGSRDLQDELIATLITPSVDAALKSAERLQKSPVNALVMCMQRWQHDLCSVKLSGKVRYYPAYAQQLNRLAQGVPAERLLAMQAQLMQRRAVAEHPLSAKLFIEDMLLDYSRLFC